MPPKPPGGPRVIFINYIKYKVAEGIQIFSTLHKCCRSHPGQERMKDIVECAMLVGRAVYSVKSTG